MRRLRSLVLVLGLVACSRGQSAPAPAPASAGLSGDSLEVTPPQGGSPVVIDLAGSPSRGAAAAKVVVVEYSNFRCRPCARMAKALSEVASEHPDKVKLYFKHGLLGEPNASMSIHEAAQAAAAQGKFWEYEEILFSHQMAFSPDELRAYASLAGLDIVRYDSEMASHTYRPVVERDFYEADLLGHEGTPVVYVNGKGYFGVSDAEVKSVIESAVEAPCAPDRPC